MQSRPPQTILSHAGGVRVWTRRWGRWQADAGGLRPGAQVTWIEVREFAGRERFGLGELSAIEPWWRERALGAECRRSVQKTVEAQGAQLRRLYLARPTELRGRPPRPHGRMAKSDLRPGEVRTLEAARHRRWIWRRILLLLFLATAAAFSVLVPNAHRLWRAHHSARAAEKSVQSLTINRRARQEREAQTRHLAEAELQLTIARRVHLDRLSRIRELNLGGAVLWLDACRTAGENRGGMEVRGWMLAHTPESTAAAVRQAAILGLEVIPADNVKIGAGEPVALRGQWPDESPAIPAPEGTPAWQAEVEALWQGHGIGLHLDRDGSWQGRLSSQQVAHTLGILEQAKAWIWLRGLDLQRQQASYDPHRDRLVDASWSVELDLAPTGTVPETGPAPSSPASVFPTLWSAPRRVRHADRWDDPIHHPPEGELLGIETPPFRLQWAGLLPGTGGQEALLHDTESGTWRRLPLSKGARLADCELVEWNLSPNAPHPLRLHDLRSGQTLSLNRLLTPDPQSRIHLRSAEGANHALQLGDSWWSAGVCWILREVNAHEGWARFTPTENPGLEARLRIAPSP